MSKIQCRECGCLCSKCNPNYHDIHLHLEIENLKQRLVERDNHIVTMETNFLNEANKFPSGELMSLREELVTWQDKYKRLYEAHRRVQRVNQGLEDKLLRLVDISETDKNTLTKDIATLSHKLAEANYTIKRLTEDNGRYKNDVSLAIQFLQCKQANFVSQKFDSLPNEVQAKVSTYMANKRKPEERKSSPEIKSIKVPIPTFPPTAMVYSVPKSPNPDRKQEHDAENPSVDIVSAAIMAKVLEERERERSCIKHCDTCSCSKNIKIIHHNTHHTVSTQTGSYDNALCLNCNTTLETRPSIMKIIKNVETNKAKNVPVYIHEYSDANVNQIVATVQPNNFLNDTNNLALLPTNNSIELTNIASKLDIPIAQNNVDVPMLLSNIVNSNFENGNIVALPITQTGDSQIANLIDFGSPSSQNKILLAASTTTDDVLFFNVNEKKTLVDKIKADSITHHRLCHKSADETINIDKTSAKLLENSDLFKGPRYCSMRLQTGSKNILLDNAPNNISPVLYTRHHEKKLGIKKEYASSKFTIPDSISSDDCKTSTVSDNSSNQRVAEWIQSNNNVDVGSASDYSESLNSQKTDDKGDERVVNKEKYKEMEDNVKKFLFGEYNFMKTVEIGKLKYETSLHKPLEDIIEKESDQQQQ